MTTDQPGEAPTYNPTEFCMCGCGQKTPLGTENRPARGIRKGHPTRFLQSHGQSAFRLDRPRWAVNDATGCWEWTGHISPIGYGRTNTSTGDRLAHRAVYKRLVGPIPDGLELDHLCRNRRCVNPDHLEPVTHAENTRRMVAARRSSAAEWSRG